jgi:hypothetical protein
LEKMMNTQPKVSPLEEAFKLLAKWKKTKSINVREQCVKKLFSMGYVVRPALMIIMHDEVHSDVLNEGNQEWTLYSRRTMRPVTPPNATWQVAIANVEAGKPIFNQPMRKVLLGDSKEGIGSIVRQEDGRYTIDNKLNDPRILVLDVPGDQLDAKLQELNIENSNWR